MQQSKPVSGIIKAGCHDHIELKKLICSGGDHL
jgi:hypothetical protein